MASIPHLLGFVPRPNPPAYLMFINLGVAGRRALGGHLTESLGFSLFVLVRSGLNLVNLLFVPKIAARQSGPLRF
jgi:hypothetical protein